MIIRSVSAVMLAVLVLGAPSPAPAQDASEIVVRLGRIEAENRRLNGRVEELEQQNRRLEDQLKRFQEDVEFRLGGARPGAPPAPAVATPAVPRRGDAFDPAANPAAPGAPRPLGSTPPSAPLQPGRPVGPPVALPGATPPAPEAAAPRAPPAVAAPSADARADFETAFGFMQRNEHEAAELAFRQFLESHPKSGLRGAATYWLGESFHRRRMYREAAEQFLKVSTDFAKSPNAAQGMLRLGQSLAALGAADQACATFREIDKRYPTTGADFKKTVEREFKKAKCEGA